jgi:D-alanyl-D-alanine carboxypeptidase
MTRKARSLRMSRTVYKNASGLPDPGQVTTARDQALLGLAIQDRFPRYYRYFATQSFVYRGVRMSNHNRLLGRVPGVHGIKTGYIRASGFNLVSAVDRGDRRIVAVVLGGTSAGARDAKMRSLIDQKITLASVKRTAPKIVEVADGSAAQPAIQASPFPKPEGQPPARIEKPVRVATAGAPARTDIPPAKDARTVEARPAALQAEQPVPGSTEPIKPHLVKTFSVKAGAAKTVAAMSMLAPEPIAIRNALTSAPASSVETSETGRDVEARPNPDGSFPPPPPGARPGVLGVLSSKDMAHAPVQRTVTASIAPVAPASAPREQARPAPATAAVPESKPRTGGWIIQVGAFEDRDEAREKIADARSKAGNLLKGAEPYTEVFAKGEKRFYRARFAGLKESAAEEACKELKKNKVACFAARN